MKINDAVKFADIHNSVLCRIFYTQDFLGFDDDRWPVSYRKLKTSNCILMVLSIGIARFSLAHPDTVTMSNILRFLREFKSFCTSRYQDILFVNDRSDLINAMINDQIALIYSLEGSHLLQGDIKFVDSLYEAGIRVVGIGHKFYNEFFIDSGHPEVFTRPTFLNDNSRLSPLGRLFVIKLIEKGITLDVSHLGKGAFNEIIALNAGRNPIVASHSNAKEVCDTTRNLDDDQLRAIAKTNGVIGVCLHSPFLSKEHDMVNVSVIVDHIEHMLNVVGPNHVAVGTDLEGRIDPPSDLKGLDEIPKIVEEMRNRDFPDSVISKVMWENALRIIQ